jgi:ABC-type glycerol-3-phosphate transport system substrate-binding protein
MSWQRLANGVAWCVLAGCFAFSLWHVVVRPRVGAGAADQVLRVGHFQQHTGYREYLDRVLREYEALHPGWRLEQVDVPFRLRRQWTRTRFIGGTAPEVLMPEGGFDAMMLSRFFRGLGEEVAAPNPYNFGTPLEGMPWRDTVLNGMVSGSGYLADLGEIIGVPTQALTYRVFVNLRLLETVQGTRRIPGDWAEVEELFGRFRAWREQTGARALLIAASGDMYAARLLLINAGGLQTYPLALRLDRMRARRFGPREAALAYLRGDWSLDTPEVRAALESIQAVGSAFQPGFSSATGEDARFAFTQGRALFLTGNVLDVAVLRQESRHEFAALRLPLPPPRWGDPAAEVADPEEGLAGVFGVASTAADPERAVDFLRFFTSVAVQRRLAEETGRLPALVPEAGIVAREELRPFELVRDGLWSQLPVNFHGYARSEAAGLFARQQHLLFELGDGVGAFVAAIGPRLAAALRGDLEHDLRGVRHRVQWSDVLAATRPGSGGALARETALLRENEMQALAWELRRIEPR